jgi:hypothetical protein
MELKQEGADGRVEASVGPVAYIAFGRAGTTPIALCEYCGSTELDVYQKVLEVAWREGFRGTGRERMAELGWWIEPVFMRPNAKLSRVAAGEQNHE